MSQPIQINTLNLDKLPKLYAYEDYVSSLLMFHGPFYLERSIKKKTSGIGDEFEWDVVTNEYIGKAQALKRIVEIKSQGWGIDEVFKVRGWMTYMGFENSLFVVQKVNPKSFGHLQNIAQQLDIQLVDNPPTSAGKLDDSKILSTLNLQPRQEDEAILSTIRFSLHMERVMNDYLNKKRKENGRYTCYGHIADYWAELNNTPFFIQNADERIKKIFDLYLNYKNLAARVDHELNGEGWGDSDQFKLLVDGHYFKLFYEQNDISPVHIALFVELLNRISILKACVDEILAPQPKLENVFQEMIAKLSRASLPTNIDMALSQLANQPYFYLYPRFWQLFVYAFGGFILMDKEKEEKELLSRLSGIEISEIDKAFESFNLLFPSSKGWLRQYNNTNIKMLAMMPPPMMGLGANMRRQLYRQGDEDEKATYNILGTQLTGSCTLNNLLHWNSVAYNYLEKDKTLIKGVKTI